MDLGLTGRTAMGFGGSRGLGRAIAEELAEEGAHVTICARDPAVLAQTGSRIGAATVCGDLSLEGEARRVLAEARPPSGGFNILVLNSGGPPAGDFDATRDEDWMSGFQSLWMSAIQAIRHELPFMRRNGWGRILCVSSITAREPVRSVMVSNGLRAGLHGMLNALSRECAGDGITVNAIMPGYIETRRIAEVTGGADSLVGDIPMGRLGQPAEFAALAAFLASERASYITGQAIACDGGALRSI